MVWLQKILMGNNIRKYLGSWCKYNCIISFLNLLAPDGQVSELAILISITRTFPFWAQVCIDTFYQPLLLEYTAKAKKGLNVWGKINQDSVKNNFRLSDIHWLSCLQFQWFSLWKEIGNVTLQFAGYWICRRWTTWLDCRHKIRLLIWDRNQNRNRVIVFFSKNQKLIVTNQNIWLSHNFLFQTFEATRKVMNAACKAQPAVIVVPKYACYSIVALHPPLSAITSLNWNWFVVRTEQDISTILKTAAKFSMEVRFK